jgi:hypothetical protein
MQVDLGALQALALPALLLEVALLHRLPEQRQRLRVPSTKFEMPNSKNHSTSTLQLLSTRVPTRTDAGH